jgi:cell division protein FtsL
MARKLLIVIFVFTLAALSLLVIRQEQINTMHTMTVLHQKIARQETSIDALRFAIEKECSSESLGLFQSVKVGQHE